MSTILIDVPGHDPSGTVELDVPGLTRLDEAAFLDFCERNPELRIEMDRHGNLVVMPPILPDSGSDRLPPLLAKMEEWIENGAVVGILVDPRVGSVRIHRPQAEPEWLGKPDRVCAGPEMPGLEFDLTRIW